VKNPDIRTLLNMAASSAVEEAIGSRRQWPPYHTHHECYGVLAEEVAEYFDEVRRREDSRDRAAMRKELMQIAAVALRGMVEL
jgi:NTP pyrophosphatase (non-canonical NTP hydrolase)